MDFWELLEENRLMWGQAAQICDVSPKEILDWWNDGVPEGMAESQQHRLNQHKGADNAS